jgi:caa(3)-type oxidase subunit IV
MSEFHDDYPQYELMAHHSEEEGKVKRKKLWMVFGIMLAITTIELAIGFYAKELHLIHPTERTSTSWLKVIFIGLTLLKAFYIIFRFMHLGDEKKMLKYSVIAPYTVFILYFVFVLVWEANYINLHKNKMDSIIVNQKIKLNEEAVSGHGHHEAAGEGHHEEGAAHH